MLGLGRGKPCDLAIVVADGGGVDEDVATLRVVKDWKPRSPGVK
jgi:hypothetical protein